MSHLKSHKEWNAAAAGEMIIKADGTAVKGGDKVSFFLNIKAPPRDSPTTWTDDDDDCPMGTCSGHHVPPERFEYNDSTLDSPSLSIRPSIHLLFCPVDCSSLGVHRGPRIVSRRSAHRTTQCASTSPHPKRDQGI